MDRRRRRRRYLLHLLFLLSFHSLSSSSSSSTTLPHQIHRGFSATPAPNPPPPLLPSSSSSSPSFQPILADPTGNFSLGFLLVTSDQDLLALAVLHLPSGLPLWRAKHAAARWSRSTSLSFNGTLLLSDATNGVIWSSGADGDRVVLLPSSNLQIQKLPGSVLWQSFDSPSDTLVQGQNFTASTALSSLDRRFSMRLGAYFLALYMGHPAVMYWKKTALEERAEIVDGASPIYARVDPLGFLGLYQNETARVYVLPFDSFNRGVPGFRRLTLDPDGNLRAYYWDWASSNWLLDFAAIHHPCELPAYCGDYALCTMANDECGCLLGDGGCQLPADAGDLCGGDTFWELRRTGVELSYMELLESDKASSREECELGCRRNCSCGGALYNGATGYCYRIGFPVATLVATRDDHRVGYFKVRVLAADSGGRGKSAAFRVGVPVLLAGLLLAAAAAAVATFVAYRVCDRGRQRRGSGGEDLISPGTYKEFKDSPSFRAIELSISNPSSATPSTSSSR